MIDDIKWLDDHKWGVRGFTSAGRAVHDGTEFPINLWVKCADWNTRPVCGGGFHLQMPGASGFGFVGNRLDLVEYHGDPVVIHGNKAKVSQMRRLECGRSVLVEALRRCNFAAITDDGTYSITHGVMIVLDTAAPVITQSGGEVWSYDTSAPIITQSGGLVWSYDTSAPVILEPARRLE